MSNCTSGFSAKVEWIIKSAKFLFRNLRRRKYGFSFRRPHTDEARDLILMLDKGNAYAGLTDRLTLIVGAWYLAKMNNRRFKIFCEGEFDWNTYFAPAGEDWRCTREELSFKLPYNFPIRIPGTLQKLSDLPLHYHAYFTFSVEQLKHIVSPREWRQLYHELFKPTDYTLNMLNALNLHPGTYVAVHTRFLNSIEQKEEEGYGVPLPPAEQERLMQDVLELIRRIRKKYPDEVRIVLLGDSDKFNTYARERLSDIMVPTSEVGHIAHTASTALHDAAVKDFMILSRSQHLYSIVLPQMYKSGFAKFAAYVEGAEYHIIRSVEELPS